MSALSQCPAARTLHRNISNLPHPAQAPHGFLSTPLPTSSPIWPPARPFLQNNRLGENDFQSNARVKNYIASKSPSPSLSGLGIYADPAYQYKSSGRKISPVLTSSFHITPQLQPNGDQVQQDDALEKFVFLDPQPSNSWSLDSDTSSGLFTSTTNDPMAQGTEPAAGLSLRYPFVEDPGHWTFDTLSAVSGISVGLLAEQISAAADLALKQISTLANPSPSSEILGNSLSSNISRSPPWPVLPRDKSQGSPVLEFNTYQCSPQWDDGSIGINPVELTGEWDRTCKQELSLDQTLEPYPCSVSAASHLSSLFSSDSFFMDSSNGSSDTQIHLSSLHSSMFLKGDENGDEYPPVSGVELSTNNFLNFYNEAQSARTEESNDVSKFEYSQEDDEISEYEVPLRPESSSKESSPFPSPRQKKRKRPLKSGEFKPVKIVPRISEDVVKSRIIKTEDLDIDLGTPVFDAHKGVSLVELKAKAERYCLRNPGREYDRQWLILFAGKLSAQGELIPDFRCYVAGCTQINKRRDHILIHVGAHLDQRPFGCIHCPARFLRRNECKRHEVSHSGVRPYVCTICPYGATGTTFVRQDLLRRHVQRKHPQDYAQGSKESGRVKTRKTRVKKVNL